MNGLVVNLVFAEVRENALRKIQNDERKTLSQVHVPAAAGWG